MVLFYTNTLKSHHFYSSYNIKDLNEIPKGGAINETLKHKIIEKKPSKFIIMIKKTTATATTFKERELDGVKGKEI